MKRVINTTEVLGTFDAPEECELCASADATYDAGQKRLTVRLESFLRTTSLREKEKHPTASWLPVPETVVESIEMDEAPEVARDIFHRWVRKVRQAAPSLHSPTL